MTQPKPPRKPLALGLKLILVLGGISTLLVIGSVVAQFWPTDLEAVAVMHPPLEDRSHRQIATTGCGLTETARDGGCVAIESEFREEDIAFPSSIPEKGLPELRGTITIPTAEGLGPRPAIVLIHGSGPNPRNTPSPGDLLAHHPEPFEVFPTLAAHLARQGIVVLRYDKRGCGRCYQDAEIDYAAFTFRDLVQDARDGLRFLATRSEVDPTRLIVAGHSEGGHLSGYVAQDQANVVAVMMLAGNFQPFDVVARGQLERLYEIRERQFDYTARFNGWIAEQTGSSGLGFFECLDQARGITPPSEDLCYGVSHTAWVDFLRMGDELAGVLRGLHCPLFAIQGSLDINIDPVEIPRIRDAMGDRDAEYHYVPNVSHDFTNGLTEDDPLVFEPDVLRRIDQFLASVKR